MRLKIIMWFMGIVMCLVMSVHPLTIPARAQDAVTPPGLMLVILLDDSSTNIKGASNNTLTAYKLGIELKRTPTDPEDYRGKAIIDLLTHLQSDQNAIHQVAVLRFGFIDSDMRWLSEQGNNQKFVTIGSQGGAEGFNQLVQAINTRSLAITTGPGQLDAAIEAATPVINEQYNQLRTAPLKPVVLLITDDVPIDDTLANSPFAPNSPWEETLPKFEAPLSALVNPTSDFKPYTGVCAAPSGGVTFAVFALGAANWVNADGAIASYNTVQDAPESEYYPSLATRMGSIDTLDNTSLAYRIDPQFIDSDGNQFRGELQQAVSRLHRTLRCATPIEVIRDTNVPGGQTEFDFRLSAFYQQVRITVTIPNIGSRVTITRPDGSVADNLLRTVVDYGGMRREIYTLIRPIDPIVDAAKKWSEGVWKVNISEIENATVIAEADLNFDGISYSLIGKVADLTPGRPQDYTITLLKDGVPVRSDILAQPLENAISAVLIQFNGEQQSLDIANLNGDYHWAITGDKTLSSGKYFVDLTLNLTPRDGTLLTVSNASRPLSQIELNYITGFEILEDFPPRNEIWACGYDTEGDGQSDYTQELSIITRQASAGSNPDSLGSFTRVEVYYPTPDFAQTPNPTPMVVLNWNPDTDNNADSIRFSELIDCDQLQTGLGQSMIVIARFPGAGGTPISFDLGFGLATRTPTSTPTIIPSLTPTSALTPTATPTPQPSGAQPIRDITVSILSPPMIYFIIIGIASVGVPITFRQFRVIFSQNLPLLNVEILLPGRTKTEPILALWKRLPPMRYIGALQQRRITMTNLNGEQEWVCTIRGSQNGQLAIIAGTSAITVQGRVIQPNGIELTQRVRTSILYNEVDNNTGIDQNQHQLIILNNNREVS